MTKKAVLIDLVHTTMVAHDFTLEEFGALSLLTFLAAKNDGVLPDDDRALASLLCVDLRVWKRIRERLWTHWTEQDGKLVGIGSQLVIRAKRKPVPRLIAAAVRKRDGECCRYCKTTVGPFEFDHIFPRARGGLETVQNLCISCVPCNRLKADRTPAEMGWEI